MALYVVFSFVAVIIGDYLVPKIRDSVVGKIVDYLVAPIVDYQLAPIGRQLYYLFSSIGRRLCYLFGYNTNVEEEFQSDAEDFDSRKLILKEIMEALKDDQINMIGVYGVGGVGKTTLVEAVRKQAKDGDLFDEVVMAAFSQTVNIRRIQGDIADMVYLKLDAEGEPGRARQLSARLEKKKRVLVVLDDVWEEIKLEDIGIPFGAKHRGCKIILTSRRLDVCNQMQSQKNFSIQVLPEKEAWNLFRKMAGDSVDSPDLHPLAVQIAKEGAGLPIAIVTLATALKNKSLSDWRDAANQLRKSIIPSEKLFTTLELSYNYLKSDEAKSFFLLCCLNPEDRIIFILDLWKYGMGLGLFQEVDTIDEARERAHRLANYLKSSCLLLDGRDDLYVKMHDVVRDVAVSIASKDEHVFLVRTSPGWKELPRKDTLKRYTAISLYSKDIHELPDELECPQLQFLFLELPHPSLQFPNNFFLRMEKIKVLDMSGMHFPSLPPSLRYLKNLRTLCLDRCKLKDLSLIGELKKLEILSSFDSNMKELPKEIGMLNHLRLLDLTGCRDLTIIPPDVIRGLYELEGLYMAGSFDKWEIERQDKENSNIASLAELKHLPRLINLEIDISDSALWPDDLLFQKLSRFQISIGDFHSKQRAKHSYYPYTKSLRLKVNLSTPLQDGVNMLLKGVEDLQLMQMKGLKNLLYDLDAEGFQHLRCLCVKKCNEVEYIFNASQRRVSHDAYPLLEKLDLHRLPSLKEIFHDQLPSGFSCQHVCFRNLSIVKVFGCKRLKILFSDSIARDLSKLVKLSVKSCKIMEQIFGNENKVEATVAMDNIEFPHLRSLKLLRLPKLKNFCSKMKCLALKDDLDTHDEQPLFDKKVALPALEKLEILGGGNFKEIWHPQFSATSFSQLKILKVANCNKLLNVIPFNLLQSLRSLEKLCVARCDSVEEIIEVGRLGVEEGNASAVLSQLRFLLLGKLPKLEHLWWDFPHGALGYRNLSSIHIFECNSLKRVFSPSVATSLVLLQKLKIVSCQMMETIIAKDRDEDVEIIVFPQLRTLILKNLPKLMGFYTGRCTSNFPSSKDGRPAMKTFTSSVSQTHETNDEELDESTEEGDLCISIQPLFDDKVTFPTLQTMQIEGVDNLKDIWHPRLPVESFRQLRWVGVYHCHKLLNVVPSNLLKGLMNLEEFYVTDCDSVEIIFEIEGLDIKDRHGIGFLSQLRKLKLFRLPKLRDIWLTQDPNDSLSLRSLSLLHIDKCNSLRSILSPSIAASLVQLEEVDIDRCVKMEAIVMKETEGEANPVEIIVFPRVHTLKLRTLLNLTSFHTGSCTLEWPSLKKLWIFSCPRIKSFTSKHLFLQNLQMNDEESEEKHEESNSSISMRPLFDEWATFPILEELKISGLYNLKDIWHPQLPTDSFCQLSSLYVERCYKLVNVVPSNLLKVLKNLEIVYVSKCGSVEIIFEIDAAEDRHGTRILSRLRKLWLMALPKLFTSKHPLLQKPQMNDEEFEEKHGEGNSPILVQPLFDKLVALTKLEYLWILEIENIQEIFPSQLLDESFCQLKLLQVRGCPKLSRVAPSNLLPRLKKLKDLHVETCNSMKEIFELEGLDGEGLISLFQLKDVVLRHLCNLRIFCSGKYNFEFPSLKRLSLEKCPEMRTFSSGSISAPKLDSIELTFGDREKRWEGGLNRTIEQLFQEKVEKLKILDGENLSEFWHAQFSAMSFSRLKILKVANCNEVLNVVPFNLLQKLCSLEDLCVSHCDSVEEIIEVGRLDDGEGHVNAALSQLRFLLLEELPKLKHIWWDYPQGKLGFRNLTSIHIFECNNLKSVFSPSIASSLVLLQTLKIVSCQMMETIIAKDKDVDVEIIVFPQLRTLVLQNLPKLMGFYTGRCTSNFPSLKDGGPATKTFNSSIPQKLETNDEALEESPEEGDLCNSIQALFDSKATFIPILAELVIIGLDNLKDIWHPQLPTDSFHQLSFLHVECCHKLVNVVPSNLLKVLENLEIVFVRECDLVEIIFEIDAAEDRHGASILSQLRKLKLIALPKLFTSKHPLLQNLQVNNEEFEEKPGEGNSSIPIQPLFDKSDALTKLERLWILKIENLQEIFPSQLPDESFCQLDILQVRGCPKLSRVAPSNLLPRLKKLKYLYVEECDSMKEIFELEGLAGEGRISLFQLRRMQFFDLPNLRIFCSGNCNFKLPSLKRLILAKCPKMQTFSSGSISTPQLDSIEITKKDGEKRWEGSLNRTIEHLFQQKEEEEKVLREENISSQEIQHERPKKRRKTDHPA